MSENLIPFFTSDQHFDHYNPNTGRGILLFQKDTRPFETIKEMNHAWIDAWNKKVPEKGAIVYCLGDLVFGGFERFRFLVEQLHFDVLEIIPGNHDSWINRKRGQYDINLIMSERKVIVRPLYHQIEVEGQKVVLCHFPMRSWNASYHGSWHLYGHVHRYIEPWGMSMDVGVDGAEGVPYSWKEVCEWMEQRELELKVLRKEKKNDERI
ncbi:MAG: hypothetical protein BV458_12130 [Thermoplasmata archaeon M9B2D]|nr:MAG: hypothetical protein BV458_12130 [Thermoplasmata archaeon M9B2D]